MLRSFNSYSYLACSKGKGRSVERPKPVKICLRLLLPGRVLSCLPTSKTTSNHQKSHSQYPKTRRLRYCCWCLDRDGSASNRCCIGGSIKSSVSNSEHNYSIR